MMKYNFLFLLFFTLSLFAQDSAITMRLSYGKASTADLGEIVTGTNNHIINDYEVVSLNSAFLLGDNFFDIANTTYYSNVELSYFKDYGYSDAYELTMFLKVFYHPKVFKNYVRFGFGEGISYVTAFLQVEKDEAIKENGKNSKFLNYLDITLDFNVGKLLSQKDFYIGLLLKHRSGIFGLINNVEHGGSNYNCIYVEKRF